METLRTLLVEQFRPKQMGEVLLVKRLREQLEQYQDTNILLHSPPGMGKTSVAKILVAGHEDDLLLINGSKENGIDVIRTEVSNFCMTMSVYGGKKFILIEECDGLTEQAWNALRAVMEECSEHVRFIATCNYIQKIPAPILSRFTCINFEPANNAEREELRSLYEGRVLWVLNQLGVQASDDTIREIVNRKFPDMRSIYNDIELQVNAIKEGENRVIRVSTYESATYNHLFAIAMSGDPDPIRNYKYTLVEEPQVEHVILAFSKHFPDYFIKYARSSEDLAKLPMLIMTIADSQRDIKSVPDKVIALSAMILRLQKILGGEK
jgi:replication factor C small subunit|nr:MAG TPA: activator clamp loader [Caudoviricetes sp.]